MTDPARILQVTGGSPPVGGVGDEGGIEVDPEQLLAVALAYDSTGTQLRQWAVDGGRMLLDPDLLASGLLAPSSLVRVEAAVLAATTGPDGLLPVSLRWESEAALIRLALRFLEEAEELSAAAFAVIDRHLARAVGFGLGASAPLWSPGVLAIGSLSWLLWPQLPPSLQEEIRAGGQSAAEQVESWLVEHPELVQELIAQGGPLLEGLWDGATPLLPGGPWGIPLSLSDPAAVAGVLVQLYDDGRPHTQPVPWQVPASDVRPSGLADLIDHLDQVHQLSTAEHPEQNGTIEIQTITGPGDEVRHVVYLPGTDDLLTLPWSQDHDIRDLGTNLALLHGEETSLQQGVLEAMGQAGIGPEEPVLLVGHSQGGMVAAAILAGGSDFNVTHAVTAGSPTAHLPGFPAGTQILSLEHHGDIVPSLDGAANPPSAEQTTVVFDHHATGLGDHHQLQHYVAGAAAAEQTLHPAVQAQLQGLQEAGFLGPADPGVTTSGQGFQIVRHPDRRGRWEP